MGVTHGTGSACISPVIGGTMPRRRGQSVRSQRWKTMDAGIEKSSDGLPLKDAISTLKEHGHHAKFNETVELAIKLDINPKQADQQVRGSFLELKR